MKTAVQKLAEINKTKDELFLEMCNSIIQNYSVLSNKKYSKLNTIGNFNELVKREEKTTIFALLDKLQHMVYHIGSPTSIPDFLNRVITRKKAQTQPGTFEGEFLGIAHFRWNFKAQTLSDIELQALKMYLQNTGNSQSQTEYKNILINSKCVEIGVPFPNTADNMQHNKFKITITNKQTGASVKFDFFGSYSDYQKGITDLSDTDNLNTLECFLSDAMAGDMSFDDFCSEFGYDIDSRKAKKIHKACIKSKEKAERIFDDIYAASNELSEFVNN